VALPLAVVLLADGDGLAEAVRDGEAEKDDWA
jgi:hypothetical protein